MGQAPEILSIEQREFARRVAADLLRLYTLNTEAAAALAELYRGAISNQVPLPDLSLIARLHRRLWSELRTAHEESLWLVRLAKMDEETEGLQREAVVVDAS